MRRVGNRRSGENKKRGWFAATLEDSGRIGVYFFLASSNFAIQVLAPPGA